MVSSVAVLAGVTDLTKIDVGCPCIFLRMSASSKNEFCDNEAFFIGCWNLPCAVKICTNCQ